MIRVEDPYAEACTPKAGEVTVAMNDGSGEQTITAKNIMLLAVVSLSLLEHKLEGLPEALPKPKALRCVTLLRFGACRLHSLIA